MTNRLATLAVFAALVFAPTGLLAQSSPLTPQLMSKMLQLIATKGADKVGSGPFAIALGFNATGQTWPERQIAVQVGTLVHVFLISRGADQDIVLYVHDENTTHFFRAHRDGTIVSAMDTDVRTRAITVRPRAELREVQKELDREFEFWATKVDGLLAG